MRVVFMNLMVCDATEKNNAQAEAKLIGVLARYSCLYSCKAPSFGTIRKNLP